MPRFKVQIKHTVEEFYDAYIEAKNAEQAEEMVAEEPFDYIEEGDEEPYNTQGLDTEIVSVIDVEDLEEE